jgi:two-component system, chemotaxis family, sensor kinase CheA
MSADTELDDEFLQEMLGEFLAESEEILMSLNDNLLKLDEWAHSLQPGDSTRCDSDIVNEMFRGAHSLKGLSGMLGLDDINQLTHRIENLFDAVRNDKLSLDRHVVDLILRSVDGLTGLIARLTDPDAESVDCTPLVDEIQQVLDGETAAAQQADVPEPAEIDPFVDIVDETEISGKYLSIFIDEAEIALDTIADTLLAEDSGNCTESLMIQCHKVKGSAASIGLNRAAHLAHSMEDLLQELLQTSSDLTAEMTTAMVSCADRLRGYVDTLKSGQPETEKFRDAYFMLHVARLAAAGETTAAGDTTATGDQAEIKADEAADSPSNSESSPGASTQLTDEQLAEIVAAAPNGDKCWVGHFMFQHGLPLSGLKAGLVFERVAKLGNVFFCSPAEELLEDVSELRCLTMGVAGLADPDAVHGQVQVEGLERVCLTPLTELTASADQKAVGTAVQAPAAGTPEKPPVQPAATEIVKSKKAAAAASASDTKKKPTETLRVDIERLDQLMNLAGELVISKARFSQIEEGLKGMTMSRQSVNALSDVFLTLDRLSTDVESQGENEERQLDSETIKNHMRRLRTDLEHVNAGMKNFRQANSLIIDLGDTVHQLDRVADGIQKTVMDTRMVPVGPLFRRFKRVIRDISHGNGKDIRLVINGENTELDKRMIDELGDPLIHMIRNCADHGIESPEDREASGKSRQGTVTLDAYHRGNSILVEIKDDGKGLAPERIRNKAVEKGLISELEADKLSQHQIFQLIWEPGLSTAEKITEVSGRGMGMDIVRAKIEDLNGTVELDSTVGVGTTITIKLPLTLAILPSLLVVIEGDVIAMPVESVSEIVPLRIDDLSSVHGMQTADVRGRVVSVVKLSDLFSWSQAFSQDADPADEKSLVIITCDGRELGLIVDRLLGEQDIVIKSMAENYRNIDGIAGASILGDGSVSLILDVVAVLEMSTRAKRTEITEKKVLQ